MVPGRLPFHQGSRRKRQGQSFPSLGNGCPEKQNFGNLLYPQFSRNNGGSDADSLFLNFLFFAGCDFLCFYSICIIDFGDWIFLSFVESVPFPLSVYQRQKTPPDLQAREEEWRGGLVRSIHGNHWVFSSSLTYLGNHLQKISDGALYFAWYLYAV